MSQLGKVLLPVWVFAKIAIRRAFRDKTALFFTFLFPLIFLFIFGSIYSRNSEVSFRVALINESNTPFSKQFVDEVKKQKIFKVDDQATSLGASHDKMTRSQLDATIVLPKGFGEQRANQPYPSGEAVVYFTQNNQEAGRTLSSVLREQFSAINAKFVQADAPFKVRPQQTNQRSLSMFDYAFSGLLGFSIIGLGIFGPMNVFPELKKQGILRRLHTTPLRVWQYFLANVISNSILGLMSIALMFLVATLVFDLRMAGNAFELAAYLVLGIITILGIGLSIGGWARNERQAAPLANIVVFPLMFLSGTFFPRFIFPQFLQNVSTYLPLTPVIDGIRLIVTEGKHLVDLGPQLGLIAIWLVVIYAIAFRVFRWE